MHTHTLHVLTKTSTTASKGKRFSWLCDEQGEGFRNKPMVLKGVHEHKKMKSS